MSYKFAERHQDLPQYKEFFTALFKLKDPEVISRVLKAINDNGQPKSCNCFLKSTVEISTQTSREDFEMVQNSDTTKLITEQNETEEKATTKKRQKRKMRGPRVEKSNTEVKKVLIKNDRSIKPIKEDIKIQSYKINTIVHANLTNNLISNDDPFLENIEDIIELSELGIEEIILPTKTEDNLINKMKEEYKTCLKFSDKGLLPIQDAILNGDLNKCKRQLYIFKFLRISINDMIENENINLLLFALINKCKIDIFNEIFEYDRESLYKKDLNENNIFHIAVENLDENTPQDINLFKTLLSKIESEYNLSFFEATNSNGETVFHILTNRDKPILCHLLFEKIDTILKINFDNLKTELSRETLLIYYSNKSIKVPCSQSEFRKTKIVNIKDLKHGLTSLHQAVKNKNELLIRIFLNHFSDIDIKNHSGASSLDHCENDSKIHNILMGI